jgi:hypothetical protein
MFMNFVALISCVKHAAFLFIFNETVCFLNYPVQNLIKKVKCNGGQSNLKTEFTQQFELIILFYFVKKVYRQKQFS